MKRAIVGIAAASLLCSLLAPAGVIAAQGDRPEPDPSATPVPNRPSAVEGGTLFAVQPRRFHPGHEFRLATGLLPQDAFYKGTTVDFSYAYHFSDVFSLEILRGVYSRNHGTDLIERLSNEFDVENDPFEKAQYMISSHARFTPLYGKHVLMNRWVVHQELYFTTGLGGVGWVIHENGRSDRPTSFRPAFDFGAGIRWYASKSVSFSLEVMENLYTKADNSIDDQVYVSFGISLSTDRGK